LHPLPEVQLFGTVYLLLALAYGIELFARRNGAWGLLVVGVSGVIAAIVWRWPGSGAYAVPCRLRLCSDGTAGILGSNGRLLRAQLQPHSLRLGRHWLLVLVAEDGRRHRLLLGPGNLQPQEWAATSCWLRQPPADPFRLR
jgi:hypothetical protein